MVSQSSSVGYTIMGKTADLTVVQRRPLTPCTRRARHKRSLQKRLAVHRAVSKHINREVKGRKRCGGKKCTSNRDNRTLERIVKQNPFKNVGEIHKEWTAAGPRTTTHRRMQDMGFSCRIPCVKPLLNNRQRQKRLAWAKDKKDWTAAEWSKVMFSDESKFCISFGNQGPRVWRKRGEQGRFLTTIEGWAGRYPGWALGGGGGGGASRYLYCRYCYINYINYSLLYVHWRKKKKNLSWAA